ncbi:ABC transporter ATP-binding protein/permease [Mesorhizobium sp. M7A.F.Ca.CA.001.09.2.1]|uniref:ABC transporter ATP-binding protein/permease n=8 Tax=Mesorhizobium TaxID=68287 RepID=A0AB38TE23_9HYPH|nr:MULTISPECIES: ABC transporter ATP-binding protein/permease [Mesorhizobium]RUY59227.1 ABC transporter ATP-binding protein/permease [Mesorhizobium sp. M7A.F.Ca.CA.001.13.2.1]MDF3213325.1 ABC transporter ATP-binding protein/permease [Mesorhizobium ciceri]RUY61163.1 ABC transporter ATP-binding protein/permease [Mesorhizobium sp. M7A.F.Ca.CA.001.05.1.1]RUY71957.1 ABC transporter ATP-binding protein/permease [Mesorhizobium sp. M7A.F.Ca.CA.001.13.1.1]RUY80033.1 ABC transporter ATP-binding protein/
MSEAKPKLKQADGIKPRGALKPRQQAPRDHRPRHEDLRGKKPPTAEAAPEVDGQPGPPPEAVEPDPQLTPEEAEQARRKYLLRRFWISGRGYWARRGDGLAWPLTIGLLILICVNVGFQYGINVWNRSFFDAIEQRNVHTVYVLSAIFLPLVAGSAGLVVAQVYLRMTIQRRWRSWLTTAVIARWLANGRYYQLNLVAGDHSNPEARLTEDLRIATESPVDFISGVLNAFLSASTFIVVLWTIGGALTLPIGGENLTIPGFLVITAVIYAAITSTSMVVIGRHFVRLSEQKNQAEAEFRYTLTRVRENGESIALLGGEEEERSGIDRNFGHVLRQWALLTGQHMRTALVSQGSSLFAPVVPVLLCAPKFLEGSMSLGQVMQAASAFAIVQGAFGWLVDNYPRLADWNASARRIASLMMSLDGLERAEQSDALGRIQHGETEDGAMLSLDDLSVTLDDGTSVVKETEVAIEPGERVLVAGESGSGKSTLVRAVAGLWPWGGGSVNFHADRRLFMLPQRPYIPSGTLRRAVAYPAAADKWTIKQIKAALDKVGLAYLAERIKEEAPWDQTLSGGEKQRLAFARLLLHRPDIVVLDEATSALDEKSQDAMMATVIRELPDVTIISVAHRAELEAFHSRKITLERREGGAKLVSDINLVPRKRNLLKRALWGSGSRVERARKE